MSLPLLATLSAPLGAWAQSAAVTSDRARSTTTYTSLPAQPRALNDEGVVIGTDTVVYKDRAIPLRGPLGNGRNSVLVAVNNKGQVLLSQALNGPHYFLFDPLRNEVRPIGLNAQVQEGGTLRNIHLGYLTGLDDTGRVFGVYGSGHGPCGVVGTPSYGAPGDLNAPAEPAAFTLLGCPAGGNIHIRAMNSKGQMTGDVNRQGFLWSNGALSIFRFPGSMMTAGVAINESGLIAGVFGVGNAISEDGTVAGKFTPGLSPPQKGFTYDGSQFRLLFMQRGTPIFVTGINNRGELTGYFGVGEGNQGFLIDSATLPVAHMQAGTADLTAKAVAQRESASVSGGQGDPVDRTWQILQQAGSPGAAATLRALQAVEAAGHLGDRKRVQVLDTNGIVLNYGYISAEALRQRSFEGLLSSLISQFGAAQQSPPGRQMLVDAIAALAGDTGLNELRAAGELTPFGPPSFLDNPENRQHAAARKQFRETLRALIGDSVTAHPPQVPPRDALLWEPPQTSTAQHERLDQTLTMLQAQLGTPTALIFLAWYEVRGGGLGGLFAWQVVEQLVGLNTRGEQAQAEQVLRTLAGVPEPAKCPGLAALRASGGDRDDVATIARNEANPRAGLADTVTGLGQQLLRRIDTGTDAAAKPATSDAGTAAGATRAP